MKALIFILFASLMAGGDALAKKPKDIKDLRPIRVPSHMDELNMSGVSRISYEDAMSRLAKRQPKGYVISSIRYVKNKGEFIVFVKLTKVG
jgi:hypothetical protein